MRECCCPVCMAEFCTSYNHQIFCSKTCWKKHNDILNRTVRKIKQKQYQHDWWVKNGKEYNKKNRLERGPKLREQQNRTRKIWYKKNKDKINAVLRMKRRAKWSNPKGLRAEALSLGFKSMFEVTVRRLLPKWITYESATIPFVQPEQKRKYVPDFKVNDNVYIEAKGRLTLQDRKKHIWIKEQHPEITVHFLFSNAFNKISKKSKTTYAAWCDANGFEWADFKMGIPKKWLQK